MLKSKLFYISLVGIVIIIVGIYFWRKKNTNQLPQYETVKVAQGDLSQSVEATGKVESTDDLSLHFDISGTVEKTFVKEGDEVKKGDLLANLKTTELDAAVAQAKANLNLKIAGATTEDINYYKAAVDGAKAALNQAKTDAPSSVATAEYAVATAKNNLQLAVGGDKSQIVISEYNDAISLLQTTATVLEHALTQADNILGIDNTLANKDFSGQLSTLDPNKLIIAQSNYILAKDTRSKAVNLIVVLTTKSLQTDVDVSLETAEAALAAMNRLLYNVSDVLRASPPAGGFTQTTLDAKKTTIESERTTVASHYGAIITEKQSITEAKKSYNSYLIAYNKAVSDYNNAIVSGESNVKVKEAAYNQALANLQTKTVLPREVDLASYRAVLSQAEASRSKAYIYSPSDGIISKVGKKPGESISLTEIMVQMHALSYEVKIDIPETDVSKIKVGDAVNITLDAFGDDVKFTGKIAAIDPSSTDIQDVVYYQVRVFIDRTEKNIKAGMTANAIIDTEKKIGVLYIPSRAVKTGDNGKYVKVLVDNQEKNAVIKLGLRSSGGMVEITNGLKLGDVVILGMK